MLLHAVARALQLVSRLLDDLAHHDGVAVAELLEGRAGVAEADRRPFHRAQGLLLEFGFSLGDVDRVEDRLARPQDCASGGQQVGAGDEFLRQPVQLDGCLERRARLHAVRLADQRVGLDEKLLVALDRAPQIGHIVVLGKRWARDRGKGEQRQQGDMDPGSFGRHG